MAVSSGPGLLPAEPGSVPELSAPPVQPARHAAHRCQHLPLPSQPGIHNNHINNPVFYDFAKTCANVVQCWGAKLPVFIFGSGSTFLSYFGSGSTFLSYFGSGSTFLSYFGSGSTFLSYFGSRSTFLSYFGSRSTFLAYFGSRSNNPTPALPGYCHFKFFF